MSVGVGIGVGLVVGSGVGAGVSLGTGVGLTGKVGATVGVGEGVGSEGIGAAARFWGSGAARSTKSTEFASVSCPDPACPPGSRSSE
jgi:hypothetical protein